MACYTGDGPNTPLLGGVFFISRLPDIPTPSSPALCRLRPHLTGFMFMSKATLHPGARSHHGRWRRIRSPRSAWILFLSPPTLPSPADEMTRQLRLSSTLSSIQLHLDGRVTWDTTLQDIFGGPSSLGSWLHRGTPVSTSRDTPYLWDMIQDIQRHSRSQ